MSRLNVTNISCGVGQLFGLSANPKKSLLDLDIYVAQFTRMGDCGVCASGNCARCRTPRLQYSTIIFSDTVARPSCGRRLASYIKQNKFGDIVETKTVLNRNSGNKIRTWVWTPNDKFAKWVTKGR